MCYSVAMKPFLKVKRKGQVTLLALLLGVLGLTVGLSVVSRSLADLKQASFVDFGTKAFAAAEAGAEYGLYQLSQGNINCAGSGNVVNSGQFPGLSSAALNITYLDYKICPDPNWFVRKDITADNVLQVDMPLPPIANDNFIVYWHNSARAVEVAVLFAAPEYAVKRYAFNSTGGVGYPTSNFSLAASPSFNPPRCPGDSVNPFNSQNSGTIPTFDGATGRDAVQIRVKPLGGPSTIQVCGDGSGIPAQSYIITATARTANNTTRRVEVAKEMNGTLPSVFDNVIFSGGNLQK